MVTVAVLGCGPGGISFCHVVEKHRQEAEAAGQDPADLQVTCFEKSSSPGGVWKAANVASDEETVNMYAALWTNGPSHGTEYFDYTYDEHFHRPVTVYMPRNEVLSYMLGRVTKNCPDFFEKYVQFNKEVVSVVYDEDISKFRLSIRSRDGAVEVRQFDKCVWACGENSRQYIPQSLLRIFEDGGFKGRLIHSADTANLKEDVEGKRVLLIGGGYSGEDLALQAVKLGAEKVYVSSRSDSSYVCYTKAWPFGKVEVVASQGLHSVTQDGRCLNFKKAAYQWPNDYDLKGDEISTTLEDIDTVIFCTGYNVNLDMLEEKLNRGYPKWGFTYDLSVPSTWEMSENNPFHELIGDVKTGKTLYNSAYTHPELYHGVLISNPNMMFISIYESEYPLLATDTSAWALYSFLTGKLPIPSVEEMKEANLGDALHQMELPYLRYYMDSNYNEALDEIWDEDDPEFKEAWDQASDDYDVYTTRVLAREMAFSGYPVYIGNQDELNETGKALVSFGLLSGEHRYSLTEARLREDPAATFRDCDNASGFYSIFTGTNARPLPRKWLDIDVEVENRSVEDEKKEYL